MATIIVGATDVLNTAYFTPGNIYEFNHDHDLDDEIITLPTNITLQFNGGSLDNGTLIGNDTRIEAPMVRIFGKELLIAPAGTWTIDKAYSNWFDCYKDGYYIDPATFNATAQTYDYGVTTGIAMGTLCGASGNNDRHILQQLLNLSAGHTIITEGIYMVDSDGGAGTVLANQLTWFGKKGLTLQIDGTLKMIPNNSPNYSILLVAECENITLCGSGKLVGDLPEHQGTTGETGQCLQVNSTINLNIEGLTFEQAWGDGVYCSWRYYSSATDLSVQYNHFFTNIHCNYNRRTGLVYEKGDNVRAVGSEFSWNGHWMHVGILGMFAGINIEPFGSDDTFVRFCKEMHFEQCRANNNYNTAFRFERVIGGSIRNCEALNNSCAAELLGCNTGNEDIVWGVHVVESDRRFHRNRIIVDGNTFKGNWETIRSGSLSMVTAINNFIQNTGTIATGSFQNSLIADNIVFNTGYVFSLSGVIDDFRFERNRITGINCPAWDTGIFSIFSYDSNDYCHNVIVRENVLKYAGGQTIYGSNDSQPMPYPRVNDYLFYLQGLHVEKVDFIDNHFDDELWAPENVNYTYTVYGDGPVFQQRTLRPDDLTRTKHLMKGDIILDYGQKGLVTQGGWLGQVGVPYANSTEYYQNQIVYDTLSAGMFIASFTPPADHGFSDPSAGFPPGWTVSGDISPDHIDASAPVIVWQGVGQCFTGARPTTFNTVGRTLVEIDTTTPSSQMIQWDGSAWVVL
ncbi:MAG: hypothetical protein WC756_03025 [Taibaiella sp.]|jgi:hypothetical protein